MEEESNVVKDMLGGIRSLLKERLVSPLLPAFTCSWLLWNYRVLLTIFSDEKLETKFSVIDGMFKYPWGHFVDGILIPLSTALAYIFIYPLVSIPVYRFALNSQRKLRETRQLAEKEKLLSEEDKQKILAFAYDQKVNSQKQLDQQIQEIEQLNAKIKEFENNKPPQLFEPSITDLGVLPTSNLEKKLAEEYQPDDQQIAMLKLIANSTNGIEEKALIAQFGEDKIRAEYSLGELLKTGYASKNYRTKLGYIITATHEGLTCLVMQSRKSE